MTLKNVCSKLGVAVVYGLLSSIALNLFWVPGNIYANGITGLSQLISTFLLRYHGQTLSISFLVLVFNLPLLFLAWKKIDRMFTIFTIVAVFVTSLIMKLIPVITLTTDPVICSIFGGMLHGVSVGITLRSDFSTGGLDIIGIIARKITGKSIGTVFILFNICIELLAGLLFGWQYAFYSALSVFISGCVVDYVNTKQQKIQVMIVTKNPTTVINQLQLNLRRGITIVNDVEGGYDHERRKLLILVVAKRELKQVNELIALSDASAFISMAQGISTNTSFFDW